MNNLLCGDNLELMREMPSESVDLVATDPPFNTGKDWGEFDDRWDDGLKGYLKFMDARIREIHRLLKPTGSFYLHCDPTASHYLKVLCDTIFGIKQFRNEIVWHYKRWARRSTRFASMHDSIMMYSKSKRVIWNQLYSPLSDSTMARTKGFATTRTTVNGRERLVITDEQSVGAAMCDVWEIPHVHQAQPENIGYPTQKPITLYQRIIKASSNEGDLVLDPFCGSGTTLVAAKHLFRKYIGIDQNPRAIEIAERRLNPPQQDIPF